MTTSPTSRAPEHPHGNPLTLREFLTLTEATPAPTLRRALAASLAVETPDTPDAYSRLYRRVVMSLGVAADIRDHDCATWAVPAVA